MSQTHQDVREKVRESVEEMHPRSFGTAQMQVINKYFKWSIERKEWEDRRELLEDASLRNRFRYFRETYRLPRDLEAELEYVDSRIETAAENEGRFDAAREELSQYETCETVRRKSGLST